MVYKLLNKFYFLSTRLYGNNKCCADLDIKRDVPIVLGNINYEDSYDGDFTNRRAVIYTLSFTG